MESNSLEGNSLSRKEDLKSGITLQANLLDASSYSCGAPVFESIREQRQETSEKLNRLNEGDNVILTKENSNGGVELGGDGNSISYNSASDGKLSDAIVRIPKPLCADYKSDSETESIDSESDSSLSYDETSGSSSDSESENDGSHDLNTATSKAMQVKERKAQMDMSLADLPPIEDLKISVPENICIEVGRVSSIVDTLVVVESYKGTAALDIDTVLFLDCGKRTLGKVFDILGPITEPVYTIRFNSKEHINSLNIRKEQKVYYAPKTQHTTFIFLSEVLKHKGSDASWKDNVEAPPEFQDFSDDEEERLHKSKSKEEPVGDNLKFSKESNCRKRPYYKAAQTSGHLHPVSPLRSAPRRPVPTPPRTASFPHNAPPYPSPHFFAALSPLYPPLPPRISGPPFPVFGGLPFPGHGRPLQQLYHPSFQQRSHPWGRQLLRPPPPPPPDAQSVTQKPDGKL